MSLADFVQSYFSRSQSRMGRVGLHVHVRVSASRVHDFQSTRQLRPSDRTRLEVAQASQQVTRSQRVFKIANNRFQGISFRCASGEP
jgi:hypothetical protein